MSENKTKKSKNSKEAPVKAVKKTTAKKDDVKAESKSKTTKKAAATKSKAEKLKATSKSEKPTTKKNIKTSKEEPKVVKKTASKKTTKVSKPKFKTTPVKESIKNSLIKFLSEPTNIVRLVTQYIGKEKIVRILEIHNNQYMISYDSEFILVNMNNKTAISFGPVCKVDLHSKDVPWEE